MVCSNLWLSQDHAFWHLPRKSDIDRVIPPSVQTHVQSSIISSYWLQFSLSGLWYSWWQAYLDLGVTKTWLATTVKLFLFYIQNLSVWGKTVVLSLSVISVKSLLSSIWNFTFFKSFGVWTVIQIHIDQYDHFSLENALQKAAKELSCNKDWIRKI